MPGVSELRIGAFRSLSDVVLRPGPVCALVGEPQSGKSTVLAALALVLDPVPRVSDATTVTATLEDGSNVGVAAGRPVGGRADRLPDVLFLPAAARATSLVTRDPVGRQSRRALALLRDAIADQSAGRRASDAVPAASLAGGLEACCAAGVQDVVLLVEEPELFLPPQAQRYLQRLVHRFADGGNQVVYSTHAANLLNVGRLDELAYVERVGQATRIRRPRAIADEGLHLATQFDAGRSELLLARAALLVEGASERLALPFAFAACGYDVDREGIAVVDCGGKSNLALFAEVCRAAGVPYVILHDRDARHDRLNAELREAGGPSNVFVLAPDLERSMRMRRHHHKPLRAWQRFAQIHESQLPPPIRAAVERTVTLAERRG